MTEPEADFFVALLVNKMPMLLTLAQYGFFDMRGGSMTIHFRTNDGKIGKIERNDVFVT